jgi:DNA polymerase
MNDDRFDRVASLCDDIRSCRMCGLREHYDSPVPFAGSVTAPILLVGEAPGADEVVEGKPFVGRSGQLLKRAVEKAGIDGRVFVGNVVCCRPPGNKFPGDDEIVECCMRWITSAIEIIRPKVIVAVGGKPHTYLRGCNVPITQCCGTSERWTIPLSDGDFKVWYVPTLHPSFCLRPGRSDSQNPVMAMDSQQKKRLLLKHLIDARDLAEIEEE